MGVDRLNTKVYVHPTCQIRSHEYDVSVQQFSLAVVLLCVFLRGFRKFLLPEVIGLGLVHIREHQVVDIRVPVNRLSFYPFFDILQDMSASIGFYFLFSMLGNSPRVALANQTSYHWGTQSFWLQPFVPRRSSPLSRQSSILSQ